MAIHIRQIPHAHVTTITCITLHWWIKGKTGIQQPEQKDTTEMYPGKVFIIIMNKPLIQMCCLH